MAQTLYHTAKHRGSRRYLLLILLACSSFVGCRQNNNDVRIVFVGDILLSRNVREEIEAHHTFPWDSLKSQFQSADLVVGNLEGAVGIPPKQVQSNNHSPVFNIEPQYIPMLGQAGFNVVTIENNHSQDLGEAGKIKTFEVLRQNQIKPVYLDNSPQFFTVKGVVFAIVSLNIVMSKDSSKNQIPSVEVKQKLRLARSLAKMVIVSIHWGSELLEWPNKEQRETAKWLIKNGADLIIGGHPHVIQKPELIDGKPVFFSLGNHLFDQKYPQTKQGLMVDIRINKGSFFCTGITTHTGYHSFYPRVSGDIKFDFGSINLTNKPLKINDMEIRPKSVTENNKDKLVLEGYKNGIRIWNTPSMPIVTITTGKLDGKNDFLFALEKHFSSLDGETGLRPYVYSVDNHGIYARWRGSGLAWPIIDAQLSPEENQTLYALHRGDSFIQPDKNANSKHVAVYRWNGFGFSGINDTIKCFSCLKLFEE